MVKQKELDTYTRNEIMHILLIGVNKKGKLAHGLIGAIAKKYDVHWKTIRRGLHRMQVAKILAETIGQ